MARRWLVRGFKWLGTGLAALAGLALLAILLATQTAYGRERVRQVIVGVANRSLLGSLGIGALRFGPGCALAIDSAVFRDPDNALLSSIGPTRATCRFGALVRGRLVITSLEVARPQVVARQLPGGAWNWSRAIRRDTVAPPVPDTGVVRAARVIVDGPVRITGGNVILATDGQPTREFSGITIDASLVRAGIGDTSVSADFRVISAELSEPAITVRRISGSVSLVGDSAAFNLPVVALSRTNARVQGWLDWGTPGNPRIAAQVTADTLAFGDVAWLSKQVPGNGGGRFDASVSSAGGDSPIDIVVRNANLTTTKSAVRGTLSMSVDSAGSVVIREANLDAAPMHTDLVRFLAPGALPVGLRGALTARLVARGDTGGLLRIDTLDARYTDETGAGGASHVKARGVMTLGAHRGSSASLDLTLHRLDGATIVRAVPDVPLDGIMTGTARLDVTSQQLLVRHAELQYTEGDSPPTRLTGSGRIVLGDPLGFDLTFDAHPFTPRSVGRSFPALVNAPIVEGPVEVRGTPGDLTFVASLRGRAGSMAVAGRYRDTPEGVAIRATARLHDVDPRLLSDRPSVPSGKLDALVSLDLAGDSLAALRGTAEATGVSGAFAGLTIEPSIARLSLTSDRIVADSVVVTTSAGVAHARGALGRRRGIRDSLNVVATMSLEWLGPLLREIGVLDSSGTDTARTSLDSASGTVMVRALVFGSLDSLDIEAEADGAQVALASVRAERVHASANLALLPGAPRGRAAMRADSVAIGDTRLASVATGATSDDGQRWRVTLATAPDDNPGVQAAGAISTLSDTLLVELDSLQARLPGLDLRLVRPARFLRDGSGTSVLDRLELRGTRGGQLLLSAVVRDTGAIAVSLQVTDVSYALPPTGEGDSVRAQLDAVASIDGTALAPRGTARARARLVDAGDLSIDSVVADVDYRDGRGRIGAIVHGRDRRLLEASAMVPARISLSPFAFALPDEALSGEVTVDSLYLPDVTRVIPGVLATAGSLRTRLVLGGTARHPRATGSAELAGAAAAIPALGIKVFDANARIDVTEDRLTIHAASVRSGKDPVGLAELSGTVGLLDSAHTDLRLRMATMPVLRLPDVGDLDVTTDLRLVGPGTHPALSGTITVNRGVIRLPDMGRAGVAGVDDTAFVRLLDSLSTERVAPSGTSALQRLAMGKVDVVMGPNVWIRSAEASIQLGGAVALEQAVQQPGVEGRKVALRGSLVTQRGTYRLNIGGISRSFTLEQGSVQFRGEPELNPRLDINATYAREGMEQSQGSRRLPQVRAHLGGTLERPVLTFSSADAKLSQSELMSYLITGQSSTALGDVRQGAVTSELVASATGALAQKVAGGLFDVVDVTATETSASQAANRGAAANVLASSRLGVGKQLSNRLFLKVDAGLCAFAGGSEATDLWHTFGVSVDYRFSRDVLGSLSSAPSTNGATCTNQAAGRGSALVPRQWGIDVNRIWRF